MNNWAGFHLNLTRGRGYQCMFRVNDPFSCNVYSAVWQPASVHKQDHKRSLNPIWQSDTKFSYQVRTLPETFTLNAISTPVSTFATRSRQAKRLRHVNRRILYCQHAGKMPRDAQCLLSYLTLAFQVCQHLPQLHEESFRKYVSKYVDKIAALCYWAGKYYHSLLSHNIITQILSHKYHHIKPTVSWIG